MVEIADRLGRDAAAISRYIKRNLYTETELPGMDGDHPVVAQDMYERCRAIHRKFVVQPEVKAAIKTGSKPDGAPCSFADARLRVVDIPGKEISRDLIGRLHAKALICSGPGAPRPGLM